MSPTNNEYLQQRINTASSAQLHLMLIEGAIRFVMQADKAYEANDVDEASVPLKRAMDIVSELLAGVRHSQDEVNAKLASLYHFVFTRLTMAYVNTDRSKLAESLKILQFERETWRQACELAAGAEAGEAADMSTPAADKALKGPHKPAPIATADTPIEGGLSLEA